MMNKTLYKILIAVMLVALFATASPPSTYAGVNGQQLSIRFSQMDCVQKWTVTVRGYNQSGVYTTWSKTQIPSMTGFTTCEIKTNNAWWKGSVNVSARSALGTSYSKTVSVPTVQLFSNWYRVNLP